MPSRIIRDGFLTSKPINECSESAQNLFVRLMLVVDDYGKYYGDHSLIKSHCYPYDSKPLSIVSKSLAELEKYGLLITYQVDGRNYIKINKFNQRLRQMKEKYPDPPSDVSNLLSDVSNLPPETKRNETENETEKETEKESVPAFRECSELLKKRILERRQQIITADVLDKWDRDVRLMVERDKRNINDIITLINEVHDMEPDKGGFTWRNNILSMDKLRLRWNEGKISIGLLPKPREKNFWEE